jgi:hypothetical protein
MGGLYSGGGLIFRGLRYQLFHSQSFWSILDMMSIDALEISFLLNFKISFKKTHVICYVCLISVGIEPLFYQLSYEVKCFYNLQFFCF